MAPPDFVADTEHFTAKWGGALGPVTANCIGICVGLQAYTLYIWWPAGLYTVHMLAFRPIRFTHVGL